MKLEKSEVDGLSKRLLIVTKRAGIYSGTNASTEVCYENLLEIFGEMQNIAGEAVNILDEIIRGIR